MFWGWNNEVHIFDPVHVSWSEPQTHVRTQNQHQYIRRIYDVTLMLVKSKKEVIGQKGEGQYFAGSSSCTEGSTCQRHTRMQRIHLWRQSDGENRSLISV